MARTLALLLCAAACLAGCLALPAKLVQAPADGLELTLLHVNDMHARYEQTNKLSGTCSDWDAKAGNCYGGHARVATIIKQARQEDPNVLVLNAGDTYQVRDEGWLAGKLDSRPIQSLSFHLFAGDGVFLRL